MTEAEALDEAAKVVGCGDWGRAQDCCFNDELNAIRAHAATIMENAALEAKLADVSKALMATAEAAASSAKKAVEAEAKLAVAREALDRIEGKPIPFSANPIVIITAMKEMARAALKEIEGD